MSKFEAGEEYNSVLHGGTCRGTMPWLKFFERDYPGTQVDPQLVKLQQEYNQGKSDRRYKICNLHFCENISDHPLVAKLHNPYKQVLCTTLLKAVEDNLDAPVTSQLSLFSELALVREIACEPIGEYSFIIEKIGKLKAKLAESNDNKNNDNAAIIKALDVATQLRDINAAKAVKALEIVKEFCDKAAKVDSLCREKFSVHSLHYVVAQMTRLIHDVLHDKGLDNVAEEIEVAVRENLVLPLPESANSGDGGNTNMANMATNLTPDIINETVKMMDDMCPAGPDE